MLSKTQAVFLVKVWLEPTYAGPALWRAMVMDTLSKEKFYFNDPAALNLFLLEALTKDKGSSDY